MLLQQESSSLELSGHDNRFELVQKKLKGIAVGSCGTLQVPISFRACSLEESTAEVQICMDPASVSSLTTTDPLLWHYPIKVRLASVFSFVCCMEEGRIRQASACGQPGIPPIEVGEFEGELCDVIFLKDLLAEECHLS